MHFCPEDHRELENAKRTAARTRQLASSGAASSGAASSGAAAASGGSASSGAAAASTGGAAAALLALPDALSLENMKRFMPPGRGSIWYEGKTDRIRCSWYVGTHKVTTSLPVGASAHVAIKGCLKAVWKARTDATKESCPDPGLLD